MNSLLRDLGLADPRWPWVPALVGTGVVVLLALLGWWARRARRTAGSADLLLAHTARMRGLARYRELIQRQQTLGLLLTSASLLVVAGTALVLARPQTQEDDVRAARGRDLMLCLDASASMDQDNTAVVHEMRRIVDGLRGDRVGMMIWSGAAVQVFPLTDDYDFVDAQLDLAEAAFAGRAHGFYAGVDLASERASVIGDGIVSCVDSFDPAASQRTRAVIVSSDNDPLGAPAYPLPEAGDYAATHHVLVYGIGAASLGGADRQAARQEFADATARTGGNFELLGHDGGAQRIVDRIDDLEKARATEPPRAVTRDTPYVGMTVSGLGVGALLVTWIASAGRDRRRRARGAP